MKRIFAVLLSLVLAMAVLAGCMNNKDGKNPAESGNVVEDAQQAVDDVKNAVEDTVDKSKFIGEEEAKKKALERAGISAEGVMFDRVELDRDDGVWLYELDFRHDGTKYDVDIKADSGEVQKFETKKED